MPFQTVKDLKMYYREQGSGDPILFIHGNVSSGAWWDYTFARMQSSPYHLIAPDLRGRGDTEGKSDDWTIATLADDVHTLAQVLQLGKVHLVGHSLGALVCIQYALDHHHEVRSLTLLAPGWVAGDMPAELGDPARIQMLVANKAMLKMALRAVAMKHPQKGWDYLETESLKQTDAASLRTPQALYAFNVAARLGELGTIPTLITRGVGDMVVPEAIVMHSVKGIPGAHYVQIADATHSPNVETPDEWVRLLRQHVEGVK
ncbi:MAG: alpha/beta hydrolase [Anaerolinea sp.]|nr:alpha/beta hydrolase [Anaerolinea sp.]